MTHIHKDALTVHLLYHFATEGTQSAMLCVAASRVADVIVAIVTERHIDNSTPFKMSEQTEVASDGITVLDASQDGLLPLCLEAQDVLSRLCQFDAVTISLNYFFYLCILKLQFLVMKVTYKTLSSKKRLQKKIHN